MATAYVTDAYNNAVLPDSTVPAGVLLSQSTTWTAGSGTATADTIRMLKIPKGAVLVDVVVAFSAGGGSATMSVGDVTAATDAIASATSVGAAFSTVGAGAWSMNAGGVQGTTAIATATGTIQAGTKFLATTGLVVTNAATKIPAGGTVAMTASYYMDHGNDLATLGA
jgi:hypothetical protein